MKKLAVIQHTSADYLGLMEDHFEGRRIRFQYFRPFADGGKLPGADDLEDGLVLLGGGPWGTAGERDIPSLKDEIAIARACYMAGKPIFGVGAGAQILAIAADGSSEPAPYQMTAARARRTRDDALGGFLPESFPNIVAMRDRPVPPKFADILATGEDGSPQVFQIGERAIGFCGHPGMKRAIAEDLIMEFEEQPESPLSALDDIGARKREIEDALILIMTGVIQLLGLME